MKKGPRFDPASSKDEVITGTSVSGMLDAVRESLALAAKRLKPGEKAKVNIGAILKLNGDGTTNVKLSNSLSLKRELGTHQISLFDSK